ncbi:MAG: nuclear transport factor 2 family protein [Deltaproteobacteria bacterium]|nr:MAG: nuclear transport factor 2 family protein [Deltaproteobacteria bacterium]
MSSISFKDFDNWLRRYGDAWEKGDPGSIKALFTSDAQYYETPFDAPMIGLDAIIKYWRDNAVLSQEDVSFCYNVLAVDRNVGLARWSAHFKRLPSGNRVKLDGIFKAEFSDDGKCGVFREWWHRIEEAPFD